LEILQKNVIYHLATVWLGVWLMAFLLAGVFHVFALLLPQISGNKSGVQAKNELPIIRFK